MDAARAIIRETDNLDLPMRALSSRAMVSMSAPYALFGSKSGVVAAILEIDQIKFAEQRADLNSADLIEQHFDSLRIGMDFYASNQSFYRALFRMSSEISLDGQDPTRLNHGVFLARMKGAQGAGLLRSDLNVQAFSEMMTDLFSAGVRAWAGQGLNIESLYARLGYGYAIALSGAGSGKTISRMLRRATEFERLQNTILDRRGRRRRGRI